MANWTVTINGTGQLNGSVPINKTVEMDERAAKAFLGSKRADAIETFVRTHYPGVKINPKLFSANVNPAKTKSASKKSSGKSGAGKALIGGAIGVAIWNELKSDNKKSDNSDDTVPFNHKIQHVTSLTFGGLEDTKDKLKRISVETTGYRWKMGDSQTIKDNNRALTECLKQYKYGFKHLKTQTTDEKTIKKFKRGLSWLRWKKFLNYTWPFLIFIGFILLVYILYLLGYLE